MNIFPPKKSLKNLVMNVLLRERAQSVVQIAKSVRDLGKSCTYQGVHKILNQLANEKILANKKGCWSIEESWLASVGDVLNKKRGIPVYDGNAKCVHLESMSKAFEFFVMNAQLGNINTEENRFICHFKNVGLFILDREQKEFMKSFAKENECHILIENNNVVNRFCAKYLTSLGMNVYLGIPRSTPNIIAVYGGTLMNVFFHFDAVTELTAAYNRVKSFVTPKDLLVFERLKDDPKRAVTFTFETNKAVVESSKSHLLKLIEENKEKIKTKIP